MLLNRELKGHWLGLDHLISHFKIQKDSPTASANKALNARREAVKNLATFPLLGVLGWGAFKS
jgi:hypothetical protein